MKTASSNVKKAATWLLRSGIQHENGDAAMHGGVAAWYELDKALYPFLYSEITGYALSAYLFLNRINPNPLYIKKAKLAAQWLMDHAMHPEGGVKTRLYLVKHYVSPNYCFHHGRIYSFDTAMAGYGVLQLYRRTREARYLVFARELMDFLTRRMRRSDGLFWAYFDSTKKKCGEDLEKWSDQAGTFHAKLALFLTDYFQITGESRFRNQALRLLDAVLAKQQDDGRFITSRSDRSTHLHPHAYTLEGLLYGGVYLKRKEYVEAALKGFRWMLKGVSDDGSVSSLYANGLFSHHERSDIVAQALRLGAALYALRPKAVETAVPILDKMRRHLLLFQYDGDSAQAGGFIYGAATDGLMRPHLNAWATMFSLQALWMHGAFVVKKRPLELDSFI